MKNRWPRWSLTGDHRESSRSVIAIHEGHDHQGQRVFGRGVWPRVDNSEHRGQRVYEGSALAVLWLILSTLCWDELKRGLAVSAAFKIVWNTLLWLNFPKAGVVTKSDLWSKPSSTEYLLQMLYAVLVEWCLGLKLGNVFFLKQCGQLCAFSEMKLYIRKQLCNTCKTLNLTFKN